ncbi:diaminopimelate epimerase [Candidatus Schneideria nysicola]|uniref:diaminopimelate epimerase n=1 Tax=Candidatus Schneideria nysicola TaxID=1081631 RepID=UPI001CAA4927|nr:diaminopimelate epimerase [Candidatus Schneideria nysicola]UAJ65435.1 diaminopimelate epimerase [Candidatus Schneideria nysicola]
MKFSKMHGLGNDFMIVESITQNINISTPIIKKLSNRHYGIGFDQLLIVEHSYEKNIDFHYRIFNADGTETFQCGNGARCFAHFVKMKNLTNKEKIYVSTKNRCMLLSILDKNLICVDMGEPDFNPQDISFVSNKHQNEYKIPINNQIISCGIVSVGNPHCVIVVEEDWKNIPIDTIGPQIEKHSYFPNKINVNFMQIINRKYIRLRVYERGTGETQACGSGACASVAIGIQQGLLDSEVTVELLGGKLTIFWKGKHQPIYMTGPSVHVYDGFINL